MKLAVVLAALTSTASADPIAFTNLPDREVRFKGIKGPPGGRSAGTYLLEPIDGGQRTRIRAAFYLDVRGPAALVVSDSTLKRMRHAKLRADLGDVLRAFPPRVTSSRVLIRSSPPSRPDPKAPQR